METQLVAVDTRLRLDLLRAWHLLRGKTNLCAWCMSCLPRTKQKACTAGVGKRVVRRVQWMCLPHRQLLAVLVFLLRLQRQPTSWDVIRRRCLRRSPCNRMPLPHRRLVMVLRSDLRPQSSMVLQSRWPVVGRLSMTGWLPVKQLVMAMWGVCWCSRTIIGSTRA